MENSLIIVDSPAKGELLQDYYQGKAEILVAPGPIFVPDHKTIAVGQQSKLVFNFEIMPKGREFAAKLLECKDRDIFLAFDADSRSEYLGWQVSSYLKSVHKNARVKRVGLAGMRVAEISEALQFVGEVDEQQGHNFYTRSLFDSLLARNLSRLIGTSRGPGNFPLQYNSLTAIFLLADRALEIQMFAPTLKWQVLADLRLAGRNFTARLEEAYDITVDGFVKDSEAARRLIEYVHDDEFVAEKVERSELYIQPPAPYLLVELLHDAIILYGVEPKELLAIVIKLFHGMDVKGKRTGLISSSCSLENANTADWFLQLRQQISEQYGDAALGKGGDEPVAGMILPLHPELNSTELGEVLTAKEAEIYGLIRSRALASQMKAAVGENISVEIAAGPESFFVTKSHSIKEQGFLQEYQGKYAKLLDPCPFADIEEGQAFELVKLRPEQTGGVPAEHYTFESLFADLADFSIAPEPVNILMLQAMIKSGYVSISANGYIEPGNSIGQVADIINRAFPRMQGINLSAYIEQTIAEVVSGRKGLDFALKQFDQTLMLQGKVLVKVKVKLPAQVKPRKRTSSSIIKTAEEAVQAPQEKNITPAQESEPPVTATEESDIELKDAVTEEIEDAVSEEQVGAEAVGEKLVPHPDEKGPADQGEEAQALETAQPCETIEESPDAEVSSRPEQVEDSAFVEEVDDEWPDDLKKAFEQALSDPPPEEKQGESEPEVGDGAKVIDTDQEHKCQVCGKEMLLKEDRFGKFWSCSGFPGCRHSEAYGKGDKSLDCPLCSEGKIVNKRTPTGKTFYVCLDPECEFMAWSKPHYVQCQMCDSPYLVEKKNARGTLDLRCPRAGCDYVKTSTDGGADGGEKSAPAKKKIRVRRRSGKAGAATGSGKKKVRLVRRKKK